MDMEASGHGQVTDLRAFDDTQAALRQVETIYRSGIDVLRKRFGRFAAGDRVTPAIEAFYPYVGIEVKGQQGSSDPLLSYGRLPGAGVFGTTLTRPDLFLDYYRQQFELLLHNYGGPLWIGASSRPIPLPFAVEEATADITAEHANDLQRIFPLPDLSRIDDAVVNGHHIAPAGGPRPLALFSAERVDYSLLRLSHYTATSPRHFQRFVLFTNYQRYVEEFVAYGRREVTTGTTYTAFVEPGDVYTPNPALNDAKSSGEAPQHLPQMPAYHLLRDDGEGVTLVNIGIGPSNAKTITDHIAVLRPHCWLMVGHCGGLRRSQMLGDYALAHAYVRADHVLDADLPAWVPIPPIAEVQQALQAAVASVTGLTGRDMKMRLRTGTVFTTDDRDWELRLHDLALQFNQSRAIAIDMESATIATNGYRFRVPYGTLLCVSDRPLHGEIKLRGMANAFYRERISQHLTIGLEALRILREAGTDSLHSRKLRSFDEPAFR